MKLIRYMVTNFRSVKNSSWIDAGDVVALVGVNESGKTNLLMPLWKLNPAREGAIHPNSDYPKRMYGEIRANPGEFCFINAEFETGELAGVLAAHTQVPADQVSVVQVSRYFDGHYQVAFPNHRSKRVIPQSEVFEKLDALLRAVDGLDALKQEAGLKEALVASAKRLHEGAAGTGWDRQQITAAASELRRLIPEQAAKTSSLVPRVAQTLEQMDGWLADIGLAAPQDVEGVKELVIEALPKFVYYSNYGNLDSEIYLPHVVQNLERADLGAKEAAKARTLRVLFSFVGLAAPEILELGRDTKDPSREPTPAELAEITEKKRERSILLQSAGTTLTAKFKEWWKQGDYRFRFEADGNFFRIWVSDQRRPEEIELENRSTGLQWFLSFFLVFLVESRGEHRDAVLLLDEPGLSLHPIAQRDLSIFFDGLAPTNQIIYTTHSPFLVDADRLDRVRKVYIAEDGTTQASANLRQVGADPAQAGAAYAVYSALNMSVSESLLLGCTPIVVEGPSDQHYLTLIKALLIGAGKIAPRRELVFPPAGGTKTLRITASILTGRDDKLPVVLLDGDEMGARMWKELSTSLYGLEKDKLLSTDTYAGFSGSELEDLMPKTRFAEAVDRIFRNSEQPFADAVESGRPFVPQVEAWAKREVIDLYLGWKVDVAKRVKQNLLARGSEALDADLVEKWTRMFNDFDRFTD